MPVTVNRGFMHDLCAGPAWCTVVHVSGGVSRADVMNAIRSAVSSADFRLVGTNGSLFTAYSSRSSKNRMKPTRSGLIPVSRSAVE